MLLRIRSARLHSTHAMKRSATVVFQILAAAALHSWSSADQQICNDAVEARICVVESIIRTSYTYPNGDQQIAAAITLEITNRASSDISLSVTKDPLALLVGGVAISRLANRTGLVGIKRGENPRDFVAFGASQSQRIAINFEDTFNTNEIEAMGSATTGLLSGVLNISSVSGARQISMSLSGFPLRNTIKPK